ncbi:RDD family protein [Amycolatopsis taiwanensis]|uniref:Transporter n=1 Tax=Amycolatopsis taiwanensis TaxID=342230 RepID=A0A9W6VIA1_9PSEU|nr:RDD family protein [Amycolatopsis taiwanensis]GLY68242.1 transporter [Amycolatopsis taiwanensis]
MSAEPELVTGEAVVLDLRIARLASRGVAAALDALIQFAVLLAVLLSEALAGVDDPAQAAAILLGVFVLVRVGYSTLFETLGRGRSLGKMALGLRVVRDDGGPIRFRHALTRALTGVIVDFGPVLVWSVVAVVVSLCSARSKRVGDFLAGTVVIQERSPDTAAPQMFPMPPALASWAGQLDLSGLTDDLALAIRQYLARYHQLRPEARDALGHDLVWEVAGRIGASPPHGVPGWAYLQAVLAERRNRAAGQPPVPAMPVAPASPPQAPPPPPAADHPFTPPA